MVIKKAKELEEKHGSGDFRCIVARTPKLWRHNVRSKGKCCIVMASGKTWLMEEQKEQALIRRRAFCTMSDQSLGFLSHMSIYTKHFHCFLHNLKTIYECKHMERLI